MANILDMPKVGKSGKLHASQCIKKYINQVFSAYTQFAFNNFFLTLLKVSILISI